MLFWTKKKDENGPDKRMYNGNVEFMRQKSDDDMVVIL